MNTSSHPRRSRLFPALAMAIAVSLSAQALTITTRPTFTPAPLAPLAGLLQLSTDIPSRVSVSVSDGTNTWQRNFYDYSTAHSTPLLGFKPGRTNIITVTVWDGSRNSVAAPQPLLFVTGPLPDDLPPGVLLTNQPAKMEPGYTLFRLENLGDGNAYLTAVDNSGEVVWYSAATSVLDVRQLPNGHLFLPLYTNFVEIDMLGQTIQSWGSPDGSAINYHDGVPTSHDSILYITDAHASVSNFPSSPTDPNAPLVTTNVLYNNIMEMSTTNGALLNTWSLLGMLQPTRITYLTYSVGYADLEHANAVLEDPSDDSIIVSMRHQNAVIKFSRADGRLKWILGPHDNWSAEFQPYLLTPVGTPFAWNYGQHGPMLTPQGTLLVYDDGNFRADPFDPGLGDADNYSRSVEYSIDEQTMEVSQVWEYSGTNVDRLYTGLMGNTDWLPNTGNVLVNFAYTQYENGEPPSPVSPGAPMLRIKEVTHDPAPEVVFDLAFFDYGNTYPLFAGYYAYRSHRIPDLYSTLPAPVQDLAVQFEEGFVLLQFSGSEAGTHTIQASTDLAQWVALGTALDTGNGNFEFTDFQSYGEPARFYRVLTQ
jgi:arylsulfate sulfotransferase